jgi:hypothetical protein
MKGEQDRLKALEKELKATKIALAEKAMALDAMETVVSLANRHYGTDLKKIRSEAIGGAKVTKGHSIKFLSGCFGYSRDGYNIPQPCMMQRYHIYQNRAGLPLSVFTDGFLFRKNNRMGSVRKSVCGRRHQGVKTGIETV